jgi:hypothetical protein
MRCVCVGGGEQEKYNTLIGNLPGRVWGNNIKMSLEK